MVVDRPSRRRSAGRDCVTEIIRPAAFSIMAAAIVAIAGCMSSAPGGPGDTASIGVAAGSGGFATILSAPPSTSAPAAPRREATTERVARERGVSLVEAERMVNPDEAVTQSAMILDQRLRAEGGRDYVGMRIVRDPDPRFAFQFRRDAAATLARFTADRRFVAVEGGVPREELQPLFDEWWARLEPHRVLGGGSVMEFDGEVRFDMTLDEAAFTEIAVREGWIPPERLHLNFPPPPNPRVVDPALASAVRVFARQDRAPGAVLQAALGGRLILRDGCFRLQDHGDGGEPLVLFGRDVELTRDEAGHMIVSDPDSGRSARVGERVVWSGPRGVDPADAGAHALRAACGDDPIVAVGEPVSAAVFNARVQGRR